MQDFAFAISLTLLIPYVLWGIYTLRLRYQFHEELPLRIEVATMIALFLYYGAELMLAERSLSRMPVLYLFTILGLATSGMALYGHIFISLLSRVLVDAVIPNDDLNTMGPRFGPAESLERVGDFEGALKEYLVLARIFPKDPSTSIRVANTYAELNQFEDAAAWFERALARTADADRALTIVNRLCGLYDTELDEAEKSNDVLQGFLNRFPDSEFADRIRLRLARRSVTAVNESTEGDLPPSPNLLRL